MITASMRLAGLIVLVAGSLPAMAQFYAPPDISEWEYGYIRCDTWHEQFLTEGAAVQAGAENYYEVGCGWEVADPRRWGTREDQTRGPCGSSKKYPKHFRDFRKIESINMRKPSIRYWHGGECRFEATDGLTIRRVRSAQCPEGTEADGLSLCTSVEDYSRELGECEAQTGGTHAGNPIHLPSGNKFQAEIDVVLSAGGLEVKRYYNSLRGLRPGMLGSHWRMSYQRELAFPGGAAYDTRSELVYIRDDGKAYTFRKANAAWQPSADVATTLTEGPIRMNATTTADGYLLAFAERTEHYDANGLLRYIDFRDHRAIMLSYNSVDQLVGATDVQGRAIDFAYAEGRLASATTPAGNTYRYQYDDWNRLAEVVYPSTTGEELVRRYVYEDTSYPRALTGIIDASGYRHATWAYDADGRAMESYHGTGAGKVTINRSDADTVEVTQPAGAVARYDFVTVNGIRKLSQAANANCAACGATAASIAYNTAGLIASETDHNGSTTTHTYNDRALETSRTEAAGTAVARTVTTDWHESFQLPVRIIDGDQVVDFAHNSAGQVIERTVTDPVTGDVRTWAYTYCTEADTAAPATECPIVGLRKTVDGPRTDVADVTRYAYYTADAADGSHRTGDLRRVTNAAGHVTDYLRYDGAGRLLEARDPNGLTIRLSYDARGRLTQRRAIPPDGTAEPVTTLAYDAAGNVVEVIAPSGATVHYDYDAAHRLIAIEDTVGNRIDYSLDAAGNRTAEHVYDTAGTLRRELQRTYNTLGRLTALIDARGHATSFDYDANGNRTAVTDANGHATDFSYDALDRLTKTIDAARGETTYTYDARDNLTGVTDATGLTTSYTYDGLDTRLERDSPDTGTTTYAYDAAGNRSAQTDARGVSVAYGYDALNRLTSVDYADDTLDVAFTYDEGTYGTGRRTGMTDAAGTTNRTYDAQGRLSQREQVVDGHSLAVAYGYDAAGRLTSLTYPSGATLGLAYSAANPARVAALTWNGAPFLSDVAHAPFGPAERWAFANGRSVERPLDTDGRVAALGGSLAVTLDYGPAGNLVAFHPSGTTASDADDGSGTTEPPLEQYVYDALNRLTEVQESHGAFRHRWTYDAIGNRLTAETPITGGGTGGDVNDADEPVEPESGTTDGGLVDYTYATDSHHLLDVGGTARSYDAAGNTVEKGALTLAYNDANRLAEVQDGGATLGTYTYNGLGERVKKVAAGETTYFVYSDDGRLLGEYDAQGAPIAEYLWLEGLLVGVATPIGTYAVETDHLGTPRVATGPGGTIAWKWPLWDNAFGQRAPRTSTDGDGPSLELNLRFPGQYFDVETGLYYNYFRYYDSSTGRYIASDPIGLEGGLSTYGYALESPLRFIDPTGENPLCPALIVADGPAPFGDIACGCMVLATIAAGANAASGTADALGDSATAVNQCNSPEPEGGCDNGDCRRLYQQISRLVNMLQRRHRQIRENVQNLPESGRFSVGTHQGEFVNRQRQLRKLLTEASSKGCTDYRGDAWHWATRSTPRPSGR